MTLIRTILLGEINRAWAANRYGLGVILDSNDERVGRGPDPPLKDKITLLLQNRLLPTMRIHQVGGVLLLSSTIDLLKRSGLDRISMQQLADLTGFQYDRDYTPKIEGRTMRAVVTDIDALTEFLQ